MTDVRLFDTPDGGDIEFSGGPVGDVVLDGGLATASYLSMFGGNERDSAIVSTPDSPERRKEWWGNLGEPKERQYRSRTQYLLRSLPANSANLRELEDAVKFDHQWMLDTGISKSVDASATLVGPKRVELKVFIEFRGEIIELVFNEKWGP